MSMPNFDGRVAMITGGGRGIGRVTADILAARGARVMCVARSEEELAQTGHPWISADLATPEGCAQAVAETVRQLGPIDILVCNHGLGSAHEQVVWEQELDDWSRSIRINLDGPFYLSRLVMKSMVERRYGRIVFTSSTAALRAEPAGSAYNSAKAGLLGLMRSVAEDGGAYGITSNAVLPGWVRTEMAERHARHEARDRGVTTDQVWEERAALYRAGRVVTPAEVAETIAFLASDASSGVSGESIRVALGSQD